MRRTLWTLAILALLAGCSSGGSELVADTEADLTGDVAALDSGTSADVMPGDMGSEPLPDAADFVAPPDEYEPTDGKPAPECGDGKCEKGEVDSCPEDCGDEPEPECGNELCEKGEDETCPEDCVDEPEPECGNELCEKGEAETCPEDCGDGPYCGNGTCDNGEDWGTCPDDCDNLCGDGECGDGEDCGKCPADCGACPAPAFCEVFGQAGQEVSCAVKLAAQSVDSPKAVGLQFKFNFDSEVMSFTKFHDEQCSDEGECFDWDTPDKGTIMPSAHSIAYQELAPGIIKLLLSHGSVADSAISPAHMEGELVSGDPLVMDIVFTLAALVPAEDASQVTIDEMVATDKEATKLKVDLHFDLLVTSLP